MEFAVRGYVPLGFRKDEERKEAHIEGDACKQFRSVALASCLRNDDNAGTVT